MFRLLNFKAHQRIVCISQRTNYSETFREKINFKVSKELPCNRSEKMEGICQTKCQNCQSNNFATKNNAKFIKYSICLYQNNIR